MTRIFILFIFACITLNSYSQSSSSGVYVFERAYDSNGYEIKDDGAHPQKIMVTVLSMFGTTASYLEYDHIVGMWPSAYNSLTFNYAGTNNGWYIFRIDLGMMGTSFLYVYRDNSRIRVAMSYYKGKFYQYRKFVEGEDINMTPTK
ncbi:hypothetical protein QUW50_08905 [Barnesiella viscericola]|uniref:hypothetical protein n=1 Tax=Barnesiella viscericola TaxID=397865 RepID=UPI0025A48355|nr:hypothetical protein [Barnesiella viscericola]MDM8269149.1 hypothetical protein [Barnesiella viscericola]